MNAFNGRFSNEKVIMLTRVVVRLDIGINISAGILLTFVPGWASQLFFESSVFPVWIWVVIGTGFLVFAGWQVGFFMQPGGFSVRNLRWAAVLAWGPVIALTLGLLTPLGGELNPPARIFLWVANGYMLLLGALYWRAVGIIT